MNLNTKFRILKWRVQYGESKYKKLLDLDETRYSGVFEVTDYESEHKSYIFRITAQFYVHGINTVIL